MKHPDVLSLLRESNPIPRPTARPHLAADAVRARANSEDPSAVPSRRTWRSPMYAAPIALAAVTALGVAGMMYPTRPAPTPPQLKDAATTVFAAASANASDPPHKPTQWWKLHSTSMHRCGGRPGSVQGRYRAERDTYLRTDGNAPVQWIQRSTECVKAAAVNTAPLRAPDREKHPIPANQQEGSATGSIWSATPKSFAQWPRDPVALRAKIYAETAGRGYSPDDEAFISIVDALRSGWVPADLRSSLFAVLEKIPGTAFVEDMTLPDGRKGSVLARTEQRGRDRNLIIVSQATGELIGEKSLAVASIPGMQSPGEVVALETYTRTVVDAPPPGLASSRTQ